MSLFKKHIPEENLIHSETPHLNSAGKSNPFQVPENYFDTFEKEIMQRIHFVKPAGSFETFIRNIGSSILQPQIAVAASFVIIVTTSVLLYFNDMGYKIPAMTYKENALPETVVTFKDDMPGDKIFSAIIEESDIDKKIIIELAPDITSKQIQSIVKSYPIQTPAFQHIEQNVHQYVAKIEQTEKHNQNIVNQSSVTKLANNAPAVVNNTNTSLQYIYQNHPDYQNNNPFQNSSLQSNVPGNVSKNPVNISKNPTNNTSSKLPHFVLPEYICSETSFELKPDVINQNFKYVWSTGERTTSITVRNSGIYTLTIFNPENPLESSVSQTNVNIIPKPATSIPSHEVICSGSTLKLIPDIDNSEQYSYFWIPTYQTVKDIVINDQGLYVLAITGCNTYYDSVLVTKEHCDVMIPNVITPNNDGINDYFYIQGLDNYPGTKLTIYDRAGSLVFSSNDYQNNWTGDKLPNGTYFFIFRFSDGIEKHGTLTILK